MYFWINLVKDVTIHMKKNKKNDSSLLANTGIRLLCIGLVFLLINTWLELGVISNNSNATNPLPDWSVLALTTVSKLLSAVGTALIIGFITNYIKVKYIDDYKTLSEFQVFEHVKKIVSRFSKDKEHLIGYKEKSISKILRDYPNCRTNVRYNVDAYIENGKVFTRTFIIYDEHKNDRFDRISNFSDDAHIDVKSIKISSLDNSNTSEELCSIKENEHKAFCRAKKFEKYADIPSSFQMMDSIHVEKEIIIAGEDHWQSYAAIFLTPSRGVSFALSTRDGLEIKDVIIFGDDGSFSMTINEHKNNVLINSSSWVSANNGFFILIAKP